LKTGKREQQTIVPAAPLLKFVLKHSVFIQAELIKGIEKNVLLCYNGKYWLASMC